MKIGDVLIGRTKVMLVMLDVLCLSSQVFGGLKVETGNQRGLSPEASSKV